MFIPAGLFVFTIFFAKVGLTFVADLLDAGTDLIFKLLLGISQGDGAILLVVFVWPVLGLIAFAAGGVLLGGYFWFNRGLPPPGAHYQWIISAMAMGIFCLLIFGVWRGSHTMVRSTADTTTPDATQQQTQQPPLTFSPQGRVASGNAILSELTSMNSPLAQYFKGIDAHDGVVTIEFSSNDVRAYIAATSIDTGPVKEDWLKGSDVTRVDWVVNDTIIATYTR